jgi:hypothetical protein
LGASSAEIDQQIRETRSELDQTLGVLEQRAASGARRYGLVAAGVAVGLLAAAGVIVYRKRRQRAYAKRLHEVLFETVRAHGRRLSGGSRLFASAPTPSDVPASE